MSTTWTRVRLFSTVRDGVFFGWVTKYRLCPPERRNNSRLTTQVAIPGNHVLEHIYIYKNGGVSRNKTHHTKEDNVPPRAPECPFKKGNGVLEKFIRNKSSVLYNV